MRLRTVVETPVGDIEFHGSDTPTRMGPRKEDIGLFKSEKGKVKIRRLLNKAPILINFHLINPDVGIIRKSDNSGYIRYEKYSTFGTREINIGNEISHEELNSFFSSNIKSDTTAITVVFTFNEGEERRPFNSWMIAHRMAQVVFSSQREISGKIIDNFARTCGVITSTDIRQMDHDSLAHTLGWWAASREGNELDVGEFICNAFASYLMRGTLQLNPLPRIVKFQAGSRQRRKNGYEPQKDFLLNDYAYALEAVERWRSLTEKHFKQMLDNLIGKIIVL